MAASLYLWLFYGRKFYRSDRNDRIHGSYRGKSDGPDRAHRAYGSDRTPRAYRPTGPITAPTNNFMIVGGYGDNQVAYSYDGLTWTPSSSGNSLLYGCFTVAWNGALWVAGGGLG